MLNTPRAAWALRRLAAGRRAALEDVAEATWELCSAEKSDTPAAIHLADEPERIVGYSPWTDRRTEERQVKGGSVEHAATRAHLLRWVGIVGGHLYCDAHKAGHGYGRERWMTARFGPAEQLDRARLMSNWAGSHFFGSFLRDEPARNLIEAPGGNPLALETKPYLHEVGWRSVLGVPRPPVMRYGRVRELIVYTDFSQNSFKAARYRTLRERLRTAVAPPATAGRQRVYLRRGSGGEARTVANENEIIARLTARGFQVIDTDGLGGAEVATALLDASLIVGVEGSHLSHALFPLAEGGGLMVLQPPHRFATPHKGFTDCLGMRYGFVVGEGAPRESAFRIEADRLERALDLMESDLSTYGA